MAEIRLIKAINRALADALAEDPTVVVFGEDVARPGGAFTATRGLLEAYPDRVLDTPISEQAITGAAVGAALSGLRPVVEIMFMDFITLAMDQIVNQAAKLRFMSGGQINVPMVLRTPHGGSQNAGPQHSQCLEAWLAHVPGLIVVCPATPEDSYGLLREAIRNPNPVIFVENKALYGVKGPFPDNASDIAVEIGTYSGAGCERPCLPLRPEGTESLRDPRPGFSVRRLGVDSFAQHKRRTESLRQCVEYACGHDD